MAKDFNNILLALRDNLQGNAKAALLDREKSTAPAAADTSSPATSLQPPDGLASGSPSPAPVAAGNVQITLADGTVVTMDNYPQDLGKSVQTVGANGTTELLANNMAAVATQMLADGKITQPQYNAIIALANQGHKIAGIEAEMERNGGDGSSNGKFDDVSAFTRAAAKGSISSDSPLGYRYWANDVPNPLTAPGGGTEMVIFQNLYQTALSTGALNDPNVQKVVESMASDILLISAKVDDKGFLCAACTAKEFRADIVSAMTHVKSAGICNAGDGTDSGVQCSG